MNKIIKHSIFLGFLSFYTIAASQEVTINSNLVVESDGTIRYIGAGTVWEDFRVNLDKGASGAKFNFLSGNSGPQIWYFENAANEAMSFTLELPHNWKEGSTIYPHIHWAPKSTKIGNVKWFMEYTWINFNASTPEAFPVTSTLSAIHLGPFTINTHVLTQLTISNIGISGSVKTISSMIVGRIWRDANDAQDTYGDDAGLLSLDFGFEMDTQGSRTDNAK